MEKEHYPLEKAGVWANAVRERTPLIISDYANLTDPQGLPTGHAELGKVLTVPVIMNDDVTGTGRHHKRYQ